MAKKSGKGSKVGTGSGRIASNRKARHNYEIVDTVEAGISLTGTEVKSLRDGRANLVDGFATITDNEVWLRGVHISEYVQGTWTNHSPTRPRKLLLHRAQIERLAVKLNEGGFSLVPLSMYFVGSRVKVELGLGRGKKLYDKRQSIAKRDAEREVARYVGRRAKGM